MSRLSMIAGVLAVLTTTPALAQTSPAAPSGRDAAAPTGTNGARGSGSGHHARDYQAQQAARTSLVQAIEAAEGRSQGRAVEASFDARNGRGHYEVKVLGMDGKLVEHEVDAASGQVTKSESRPVEGFFTRLGPTEIRNARTTLQQAIALAEQKVGGKAAEAEVEREGDAVRYEVAVVGRDRTREVRVDADGQVSARD